MTKCEQRVLEIVENEEAAERGFAAFNHYPHALVDVPDGGFTLSARTSDGHKISFSFVPCGDGLPPQCVDIQHTPPDFQPTPESPFPLQQVIVFGAGPTFYSSEHSGHPVTLVAIKL